MTKQQTQAIEANIYAAIKEASKALPGATDEQLTDWIMTHRRPAVDAAVAELAGDRVKDLIREEARRLGVMIEEIPLDDKGLPSWGQVPCAEGAMLWERRVDMGLDGYAWNYILRDDAVAKNQTLRDRWRDEALERWSTAKFEAEVERLREEREDAQGAA